MCEGISEGGQRRGGGQCAATPHNGPGNTQKDTELRLFMGGYSTTVSTLGVYLRVPATGVAV